MAKTGKSSRKVKDSLLDRGHAPSDIEPEESSFVYELESKGLHTLPLPPISPA